MTLEPDYLDVFSVITDAIASPREWMSACLGEGAERLGRGFIFGRLLALRAKPDGSPGTVVGWQVVGENSERLTLHASGPGVEVNLVMDSLDDGMRLTTAVRYRSAPGRLIWEQLSRVRCWDGKAGRGDVH